MLALGLILCKSCAFDPSICELVHATVLLRSAWQTSAPAGPYHLSASSAMMSPKPWWEGAGYRQVILSGALCCSLSLHWLLASKLMIRYCKEELLSWDWEATWGGWLLCLVSWVIVLGSPLGAVTWAVTSKGPVNSSRYGVHPAEWPLNPMKRPAVIPITFLTLL